MPEGLTIEQRKDGNGQKVVGESILIERELSGTESNESFQKVVEEAEEAHEQSSAEGAYETKEVRELVEPLKMLLDDPEIRARIENGEYGAIIGEDASGRIPALIAWRVVNEIYRRSEKSPVIAYFLHPARGNRTYEKFNYGEILRFLSDVKDSLGKRVLYVTEYVQTGQSVLTVYKALRALGLEMDLFSACGQPTAFASGPLFKRVFGIISEKGVPAVWGACSLSGVGNPKEGSAFSLPKRVSPVTYLEVSEQEALSLRIAMARRDVKRAAKELMQLYEQSKYVKEN
jgi:hypothetical protein